MIPPTDAVLNRISQEFLYEDLVAATNNFSASARLGEGTYGTVFSGLLRDGTEVAIKALASPKEGGFREEVEVLSRFRHPNLVILMGFARNGRERYLVYELLPGGDVNSRLNKDLGFTWKQRLNVILDAALGLSHLHGSRPQVFHRDVKTQNILMDRNGTGKVADFGLACLAQPNQDRLAVSQTSGTIGYADPLYIRTGVVTEKSEVYSLGMVLLEVLTGRPPALQHPSGRIEYQFDHLNGELKRLLPMVDRRGKWPEPLAQRVGALALQCTCEHEVYRPSFVDIVKQLRTWLRDEQFHHGDPQPVLPARPKALVEAGVAGGMPAAYAHAPDAGPGAPPYFQAQQQPTPWPQVEPAAAGAAAANRSSTPRVLPTPKHSNPFADSRQHHSATAAHAPAAGGQFNPLTDGNPQVLHQRPDRKYAQRDQRPNIAAGRPAGAGQQEHALRQHPSGSHTVAAGRQAAEPSGSSHAQQQRGSVGSQYQAGQEEVITQLVEMGYTRQQAVEACKRCSTVEAAVEWILTNQ